MSQFAQRILESLDEGIQSNPLLRALTRFTKTAQHPVYLVGGYLRDLALGRAPGNAGPDIDCVVQNAETTGREFAGKTGGRLIRLGPMNWRVIPYDQKGAGSAAGWIDFADLRGGSIEADLRARDFTINTLACRVSGCPVSEPLLDPEDGLADLERSRIRALSGRVFRDDPIRILRAYRLAAQLDFTIGPETIQWIKQDSALLARVPGERLRAEVFGILKEANSGRTLRGLRDTGLLFILFPAFTEMANVEQGGFHHTDVLTHSLETVDALEDLLGGSLGDPLDDVAREYLHPSRRLPILKLAALLHDAGKPETRADAGRPPVERPYSFHGHEKVSAVHAAVAAERLRLSARERKSLVRLVSLHMRPGWLYSVSEGDSKKLSGRALLRLARDAGGDLPGLALLAIADALSRKGPLSGPEGAVGVVEFAGRVLREMEERIVPVLKGPRWITGHDLIASLGVSEGPLVGRLLYAVEEAHAAGEIQTREQALSLAKRLAEAETQVH